MSIMEMDYKTFIGQVKEDVAGPLGEHTAVNKDKNPVAKALPGFKVPQVSYVIAQYSVLPKTAVKFLKQAYDQLQRKGEGWAPVHAAVTHDLAVRLGMRLSSSPPSKPLFDIFAGGLENELGLGVAKTKPSPATKDFVAGVYTEVTNLDRERVAGATYALTATAPLENDMVYGLVNHASELITGEPLAHSPSTVTGPERKRLKHFFEERKRSSSMHEEELRKALDGQLETKEARESFEAGFHGVMDAMDKWWDGLAEEL